MTTDKTTGKVNTAGETSTESEYPEFATERLTLDVDEAADVIHDTLEGLSATATDDGVKFRTLDGTLLAILSETGDEDQPAELHYRTEPASSTTTLKARKLGRELEPDTD